MLWSAQRTENGILIGRLFGVVVKLTQTTLTAMALTRMFVSVSIWNAVAVRDARVCLYVCGKAISFFFFLRIDKERGKRKRQRKFVWSNRRWFSCVDCRRRRKVWKISIRSIWRRHLLSYLINFIGICSLEVVSKSKMVCNVRSSAVWQQRRLRQRRRLSEKVKRG